MNLGLRDIFAVGAPYLIAVGACYQFGYWGTFQVNVLEFISFTDIAKLAVYPLVISLVSLFVGGVIGQLFVMPHLPPGGGASTPLGQAGLKNWRWLIAIVLIIAALVWIFGSESWKWFVIAALISLLSTALTHIDKLIEIVPNPRTRATIAFILLLLPPLSFAYGRLDAFHVTTGSPVHLVDVVRSKIPVESDTTNPVAYLGYLGNVYVLREAKTGQIIFVKQRDDSPLFLLPKPGHS